MATIRSGRQSALLVVDVQVGVMAGAWEAARIVRNLTVALDRARSEGVPVVWVQHGDAELPEESAAWQLMPELMPRPDDVRIRKGYNSAFEETPLDDALARLGVSHVVLAGAATNWCIRATAYAALDRGYDVTLVEDAHTTETMEFPDGRRIEATTLIDDLNTALTWLSYPGRSNRAVAAEALRFTDFGAPGSPSQ